MEKGERPNEEAGKLIMCALRHNGKNCGWEEGRESGKTQVSGGAKGRRGKEEIPR